MKTSATDPSTLIGNDVKDEEGNTIGAIDAVWVDDATDELEFVGVKMGIIGGKTHLIPLADAHVSDDHITVPFTKAQIKDAPSFEVDDVLTAEGEDAIYTYYGLDRSTAPSPSGLPEGDMRTGGAVGKRMPVGAGDGDMPTPPQHVELNLHKEELEVGKRTVAAGQVRLRKVVHTQHQDVPVDLRREEVEIERVPVASDSSDSAFQEEEINVPVMREEAVVNKESRATEQVRLNKTVRPEMQNVGGEVRSEDVEIDQEMTDTRIHTPEVRSQ